MNKKNILFVICLWYSLVAMAQSDTLVYYLGIDNQYLNSREGAEVIRIVIKESKKSKYYIVNDFYVNGKPRLATMSSADDGSIFQGPCIEYFKNGKRRAIETYKNGHLSGAYTSYYPNGKLYITGKYDDDRRKLLIDECRDSLGNVLAEKGAGKAIDYYSAPLSYMDKGPIEDGVREGEWQRWRKDTLICTLIYHDDILTSGIGYDSAGSGYSFKHIYEAAQYKDSFMDLYNFMLGKINLTKDDKKNGVRGRVKLSFMVELDGKITDVKIDKGLSYNVDEQVVKAIKLTNGMWIPAKEYGIPKREIYSFILSIGSYF